MEIKEGTRVKSNLTGELYRMKAVKGMAMVLEAEDGFSSVITQIGNLKFFYEMIENENRLKNPITYKKSSYLSIAQA
jgi:hypothetical protein